MATTTFKQVGVVGIDTAQLILTDPMNAARTFKEGAEGADLNTASGNPPREEGYPYSYYGAWEASANTDSAGQMNYDDGSPGAGVCVSTGWGDGLYPVFVEYEEETGRVARVIVDFMNSM